MDRVALYARVSSERQAAKDLSISAQLKGLRKFAASRGYEVVAEFVDEAESARTANRPAFQEMIATAKSRPTPFNAILVWKLSRFARNREDSIIYKSLLKKRDIQVISMNESIDDSPAGALFEGMIEVIDEFYSANLAQDTKRGMRENASRGYWNGSLPALGYLIKKVRVGGATKNTLVLNEDYAPLVRRVFDLALSGQGAKEIAKILNREGILTNRGNCWSKGTILYILRNEVYTGTLVWGKSDNGTDPIRLKGNHQAIVSAEKFEAVQKLIADRSPANCNPRALTSDYLLSGLIKCGHCGAAMQGCSAKSGTFHYYACRNHTMKGPTACATKMVNRDRIESQIVAKIKDRVLTESSLTELLRMTNAAIRDRFSSQDEEIAQLDAQTAAIQRRLDNLYQAIENGSVVTDDLAPRIRELRGNMDRLREHGASLQQRQQQELPSLSALELRKHVKDLRGLLSEGSIFEQKKFIRSFVKRIAVTGKKVSVEYTFPTNGWDGGSSGSGVLSSAQNSSPGWTLVELLRS